MTYTEFVAILVRATKEEEVRRAYILHFNLPLSASFRTDYSTDRIIIEFKLDRDFYNTKQLAKTIAQVLYYVRTFRRLRKSKPLPPYFFLANRSTVIFSSIEPFMGWLRNKDYDWSLPASRPDNQLVNDLVKSSQLESLRLFSIINKQDYKILLGLIKLTLKQEQ